MRVRFLAAAAAGLILATGLTGPAHAALPAPQIGTLETQVVPVAPSPGKAMPISIDTQFADNNPLLTIDVAGLADKATADTPSGCDRTADKITCAFPSSVLFFKTVVPLVLHATSRATTSDKGTVTLTSSASGYTPTSHTYDITFADAIDLVAAPQKESHPARIGDHLTIAASVLNVGSRTAKGIRLTWLAAPGLTPDSYDNCAIVPMQPLHELVCEWPDVVLAPGQGLAVKDQLGHSLALTVAPDTGRTEETTFTFVALSEAPAAPRGAAPAKHTGRVLDLVRADVVPPADVDKEDNMGEVVYTIDTHLDAAAIGATVTGTVGQTVNVSVGYIDHGPAAIDVDRGGSFGTFAGIFFARPANAEVVGIPQSCDAQVTDSNGHIGMEHKTGADYYECKPPAWTPVGVPQLVTFTLKITAPDGKPGEVDLLYFKVEPYSPFDVNPENDHANVVINTASAASTGAGGTTPVSLPVTGAPLALIAIVGAVIVAGGIVLLLLGRRRGRA